MKPLERLEPLFADETEEDIDHRAAYWFSRRRSGISALPAGPSWRIGYAPIRAIAKRSRAWSGSGASSTACRARR